VSALIGTFKHEQMNIRATTDQWLCLSLTQPWASALFVDGLKRIETRGWRTNYRGRIYIHAAKNFPRYAKDFASSERFELPELPLGHIIGHVELVDIRRTEDLVGKIGSAEERYGDYGPRRYGWITTTPVLLPAAIPAKGSLGLWVFLRRDLGANGQSEKLESEKTDATD